MRTWIVVGALACAGCGRSGFETRPDASDPNRPDADPTAPDADPNAPDADPNAPDAAMATCPGGYITVGGETSKYRYDTTLRTWDAAEAGCEADGAGIHLVVFDDNQEVTALDSVVGDNDVWTGVTDRITEGTYLTVGGVVETFLPWSTGQPTGAAEDCMTIELDDRNASDADCSLTRRSLCECDGIPVVPGSF